jgi:hypothetical protein
VQTAAMTAEMRRRQDRPMMHLPESGIRRGVVLPVYNHVELRAWQFMAIEVRELDVAKARTPNAGAGANDVRKSGRYLAVPASHKKSRLVEENSCGGQDYPSAIIRSWKNPSRSCPENPIFTFFVDRETG